MASSDEIQAFFKQHPKLLVGREAWDEANKAIETDDSFDAIGNPLPNVVVLQIVNATTNKAIIAAALVDDEKAEADYRRLAGDKPPTKCQCPEGNCDAWRKRCFVCAFENEEACPWDRTVCKE